MVSVRWAINVSSFSMVVVLGWLGYTFTPDGYWLFIAGNCASSTPTAVSVRVRVIGSPTVKSPESGCHSSCNSTYSLGNHAPE